MGLFSQLRLLIWKNFLVQKRQIIWTIFELLLPVAFSLILIILRQQVVSSSEPVTFYEPYTVDGSRYDLFIQNVSGERIMRFGFLPYKLLYTPKTPFIDKIMENVASRFNVTISLSNATASPIKDYAEKLLGHGAYKRSIYYHFELKGYDDESTMVDQLLTGLEKSGTENNSYFGGIVFYGSNFTSGNLSNIQQPIKYAIRLPNVARNPLISKPDSDNGRQTLGVDQSWDTKYTYPLLQQPGPRHKFEDSGGKPGYWREGFLSLQRALDAEITIALEPEAAQFLQALNFDLRHPLKPTIPKMLVQLNRFPYPAYIDNPFIQAVQRNLPLVLMISLALSVLYITRNVVQEKEKRLKEYMKCMGLSGWQHWIAHFITNYLKVIIAVALITLFLKLPVGGKTVITESDGSLIFVFLLIYAASAVWFSFTVSVFFKKGNTAAGCGFVVWFFMYLPWFFIQPRYGNLSLGVKLASCLLLNTAMSFGAQVIGIFEGEGTGLQWSTFATPGTIDDNFTMAHVCAMMLVDMVLCILITWYVEAIYPGDEGVPEKLWFPFQITYWRPRYRARNVSVSLHEDDVNTVSNELGSNMEADPPDVEAVIELNRLTKTYGNTCSKKKVVAVNNLSIRMFAGQVTAILGHNGAGKSTTLSMLTGIIPPSAGSAKINGYDIRTSLPAIRRQLGICPQYNSLFDHLTVEEHLELFCKMKDRLYMKTEVQRLLKILGLLDKRNSLAKTLSGGMKRKLLVAIALIGGSEIVMLDEPTSGMDPGARHEAWSLIQTEKEHRTILLTTHFMEEADLLGDRIAILARGQLQCCGTSFFLKRIYGAGYHITVVFDKNERRRSQDSQDSSSDAVLQVLHQHVPEAESESSVGMEATFLLPAHQREKFQLMLHDLESNQKALGVASFGVSITTMEEVFLKVGKLADDRLATTFWGPPSEDPNQPFNDISIGAEDTPLPSTSPIFPPPTTTDEAASSASGSPKASSVITSNSDQQLLSPTTLKGAHRSSENSGFSAQNHRRNPFNDYHQNSFDNTRQDGFDDLQLLIDDEEGESVFHSSASAAELFYEDSGAIPLEVLNSHAKIDMNDFQPRFKNSGFILQWQQFYAMFIKRVLHSFRNKLVLITQILVPIAVIAIALLINKTLPGPTPMPPLNLNLAPFGATEVPIWSQINQSKPLPASLYYLAQTMDKFLNHRNKNITIHRVASLNNMSNYILDQYIKMGTFTTNRDVIIGGAFEKGELKIPGFPAPLPYLEAGLVGYFNNQPLHGPPIALNIIDNIILNYFRSLGNKSDLQIQTINHPLPPTNADKLSNWIATGVQEFNIAFNIVFGMAFLASSFIVFLVNERRTKAKHLQFLSGVHPVNFWLATFAWDFLNYLLPCLGILILFFIFDVKYLVHEGRWTVVLMLLVVHGWAMLPQVYAISFLFTSAPGAFVKMTIFKIFSGPVAFTVVTVLFLLQLYDINETLEWIFFGIFPNFCIAQSFNEFYMNEFVKEQCKPFLQYCDTFKNPICCQNQGADFANDSLGWESPGIGRVPFFLSLHGLFFWAIVIMIEADFLRVLRYSFKNLAGRVARRRTQANDAHDNTFTDITATYHPLQDDDVEQERKKVSSYSHWDCTVLIKDLVKDYGQLRAVDNVTFAVKRGDCFGLLGVNGAGKTSTFQMLTGENLITNGSAVLDGVNVQKNWRKAGKNVGYCPQFDAVIDQLTGKETLSMFARLRGVPEKNIQAIVSAVINAVGIPKIKDRQVHTYSGGNKRRLSLGVALVGSPKVLLLDEPTTGVDPTARRAIWNVLSQIRHQGTALVLTSHSMEECEALCTRLAIMVGGKFRCLGSSQHLKGKFGAGYSLQIKVKDVEDIPHSIRTIATTFPGSTLKEVHHTQLLYELPCMDNVSWSQLFGALEKLIGPLKIVDYALSQTTLEQVFLSFSREVYGSKLDPEYDSSSGEPDATVYI